jgi:HEAT repeat protein
MDVDLRALLPRHKSDCERAQAVVALGYPAAAPVLRELLAWLQDCNWPVAHAIAPFLASAGEPVVPLIREVLRGDDDIWKYWCLGRVVMGFRKDVAEQLRPDLRRLAFHPSLGEQREGVGEQAKAALAWLDEGPCRACRRP